ncbi:MAG: hypothetical protein HEQ23_07225 [Tepidisphaera sp.]
MRVSQDLSAAKWTVRAVGAVGGAVGELSRVPDAVRERVVRGIPATLLPEVGGCVHTDLIDAGLIGDPAIGMNEHSCEWVSWTDWCYECEFDAGDDLLAHHAIELVFESLDTIAMVELNGILVGNAANEFIPHRFNVNAALRKGTNLLRITFTSPLRHAYDLAKTLGLPHNGDESAPPWHPFNMIRKCASNFGWDWGPRVPTCGFGGPVLRTGSPAHAPGSENRATKENLPARSPAIAFDPLNFVFTRNNKPIFCKGVNWISEGLWPRDRTRAKIRARLEQAKAMGCNMIRVWGGGRYESDAFYEICDELGLMVWQDFMFACACYPEEEPFRSLIEAEARYQVARLSKHPCIVLWCGGNENHWAHESWGFGARVAPGRGWGKAYWQELLPRIVKELSPHTPYVPDSPWSPPTTPPTHPNATEVGDRHTWDLFGEDFYAHIPRFCSEFGVQSPSNLPTLREADLLESPTATNGRPSAVGERSSAVDDRSSASDDRSPEAGDRPSEFGGGSTNVDERPMKVGGASEALVSKALLARQRGPGGMARWYDEFFAKAGGVGVRPPATFEEWHAQAQKLQADWLELAVIWLRANAPTCSGALIWQLNDAWPGFSWSLIDAAGREKPAYHAVKRAFADRLVATVPFDGVPHLVAINDTDEAWEAEPGWVVGARSVARKPV